MRRSANAPRTLQFTSLSFDVSFQEIFATWCAGGTLVLMREEARRDAGELWQLLIRERIERLFLPFVALQYLAEAAEHNEEYPATLREVITAGEQLKITRHIRSLFAKLDGCTLDNQYGPSETHVVSALMLTGDAADWPELPAIGRPIANAQLYLLDERLQVVPIGAAGELYIGGEVVARGYLNRAAVSAEKFLPHPFIADSRLYRTGDQARYLADGNIEFLGRRDQQVKVRGYRIELGEVEAALRQQPQVREAVVIISPTATGENRLIAYVLTEPETTLTTTALRGGLRELLPEYMIPAAFVLLAEFPLTPSGKIDRRALQARPVALEAGEASVQARTPAEEIVATIWAEVLGRETIGVHDNFFELGGHSLLATQVISRVRDAFGQEVPLRSLFEQPTVAGLAREIEAGRGMELQAPPLERVERAERLPLSFAQQRLWFLDQLEPDSSFYNIPAAVRLHGVLNVEALERTLSEVVRRHEVLRTHFIAIDGEPVQVIEPAAPIKLEVVDLSALDEAERTAETERVVAEESARPFDLTNGPLLRVGLLRLGAEEHVALVMMHHIISDGWSIGVLVREVAALYSAYVRGEESSLEELPIQYADFAHWQRNWLEGEVLAAQLDYWRAELADAPTVIDLPIDKPRPPVQTHRGAHHQLQLSTELSAQLRDLSRRHGSTLFMTLLAAFDVLLCRYAGQEQVLVGSPIANRNRSETEALIGFFVNTLVLRGDVRGNPSFSELLRRVRETTLKAYAHQDLPFEKLVEELQPERDMSRSPLFQVLFVLQNAPGETLELEGLRLSGVESAGETAKFELMLGLQEVGEVIAGSINYNRDLYEAETIGRLVASYERVLQAVVTDAEQRAWEIDLLSDAERRQVIHGWNAPAREYAPALTLSELFEAQAARTPETVALRFESATLTYRELNERSNQLAHYLQRSGVGPDVLVGILMHRSVEMIVAVLGILKAGGAYVPLDPSYPRERLAFMVQDAGLRMLLTHEELLQEVPGEYVGQTLSLNQQWAAMASESVENLQSVAHPENLAYVIYTSGSTGQPKGVLISHENVVRLLEATQPHFEFNQSDVSTLFHSYAFDFSVWEIWGALAYGGKLVIVPYWISRSAEAFHRLLVSEQVTVLNQTPSAFRQLMAADESAGDGVELKLRVVIFGGEALELQSLRPWFARHGDDTPRLVNMFGITETTVHVTYRPLTLGDLELGASSVIGRPLECLQVYLLDGRGQPVPIGVAGEICVGGTGLARGYLNRAELTAERFVANPFSTSPGARLYRSGDLARFLSNGDIEYLGRIDQQVKVRGFRIELGEIEAVLASHAAVAEAVVVMQEDKSGDKRLVAYVVGEATGATLRDYLRERVPEYMLPAAFVMLERLPLTVNGKVDRGALPAPEALSLVVGSAYIAPRTAVEEIVASIWRQLLDVEQIGVADNFFELGGHSLLATQVISRVRDAFGQEVALRSLFEQPTVAGLASEIEAGLGAELQAPPLVRVERAARLPLSFAQQRLWFLDQLEPGSSFYNIPAAVRLHGVLNVEALERTLSEVVRRHEVLRTHFIAIDGEPVQVIEPAAPVRLEVLDLSGLDEAERTAETERLIAAESARPFDLTTGPLLRVSLLRLDEEEHVVLMTMHHIVSDGWSTGILVREVAALYGAYLRGEESPLEELPIQYADFAHWQRTWLQGEVLAAQLAYWRAELGDAPAMIDLPIDKPRPPVQTFRGAHYPLQLSAELSTRLRELSRRHSATLFMTLLAAFDLLLCRYAGQEQVLIGTPIANRNRSETEGLIGFFVNTLVLSGDVRGNPSFRELLRRVREVALGAHAHQDLPFEKLVEELQPERDMSRSPLFQVMFILQNTPSEALELEGLSLSAVGSAGETAKFELTLALQEQDGVIVGGVEYNLDLFAAETIGRLVASYERVLQAVVADTEQRVLEIELLSEAERRLLLQEWNDTETEYPRETCIHELFASQVANTPSQVAIAHDGEQLSYAELNARANQLAHHLRAIGVKPGSPVGICIPPSIDMVVGLLGILKAGAAYVPLDPSYPRPRLSFILNDVKVLFLLTQPELLDTLPDHSARAICLDAEQQAISDQSTDEPGVFISALSPAYIIYTSGSTGQPKGVQISHRAVVNFLTAMSRRPGLNHDDVLLAVTSLSFDIAGLELYLPLITGARLVLASREETMDGALLLKKLLQSDATAMQATPTTWRLLVAAGWEGTAPFKVLCGGEALPSDLAQELTKRSAEVWNLYGPTETTVWSTVQRLDHERDVTIGRPIANTQIYLLDDHLQAVPHRVPGQLYIGGAGLAIAYLNQPALTAERFVPNPFGTDGARLYQTGDLARYRLNGEIEYLGRLDQQVKIRGFRIELGEIEAVLSAHESLREAIVVARETASGDQQLVAYVVRDSDRRIGAGEAAADESRSKLVPTLRAYLKENLPDYMVPAKCVLLDKLPLTPNSKIDRRALQAMKIELDRHGESLIEPRDVVELQLAHIWEELLDVNHVGVRDDFFRLGGHSLLAVRLMARIQASFGQDLPLASLFQGATIEKLASLLHEQPHDRGASALVAIQPNGDELPFFCVHPGGGNVLCYQGLANHLGLERPFYGLQARGLDENQVPHTRIEEMAAYYIEAMRRVQPDGPYLLGGWSMGGVIAYEMAQQLEARGQQVSLLALMDARPVTSVDDAAPLDELTLLTSFARDLGLPVDGLQLSTDELAKLDSDELLSYVLQRAIEAGVVPGEIQLAHARRLFEVFKINVQAMQSYRPAASSMRVTLLKAGEQEVADETMGWGALTSGEIEIHRVPGSHFTIVREPYVRSLAEQLADCIHRATLRSLASHT